MSDIVYEIRTTFHATDDDIAVSLAREVDRVVHAHAIGEGPATVRQKTSTTEIDWKARRETL